MTGVSIDARRGPYAKGVERRAQILEAALSAYSQAGTPSLRMIGEAIGLSEPGILHYFGSRDELFVAILRARDEMMEEAFDLDTIEGAWVALEYTIKTPALAKLFVSMSVAAEDKRHPAHEFMKEHTDRLVERLEQTLPGGRKGDWRARALVGALEGLQLQWLRDPSVDVVADMRLIYGTLTAGRMTR